MTLIFIPTTVNQSSIKCKQMERKNYITEISVLDK